MPPKLTPEIVSAAIAGFEAQKERIDAQIQELRAMLPGSNTHAAATETATRPRRQISAAARRRMARGQKKRWAAIKGTSQPPAPATPKPAKKKRKLSAAGRKAISEATKRRWALKRAEAGNASVKRTAPARKKAVKKVSVKKAPAAKKSAPAPTTAQAAG